MSDGNDKPFNLGWLDRLLVYAAFLVVGFFAQQTYTTTNDNAKLLQADRYLFASLQQADLESRNRIDKLEDRVRYLEMRERGR